MNKQKLISVLQSRIANNRNLLRYLWEEYNDYEELCFYSKEVKNRAINVGERQKEDKAILKQLVEDERGHRLQALYYKNLSDYTKQVERKLASYTMAAKPYLEG